MLFSWMAISLNDSLVPVSAHLFQDDPICEFALLQQLRTCCHCPVYIETVAIEGELERWKDAGWPNSTVR